MKLIVEHWDGQFYVYTEDEKHHRVVQPKRKTERVDPKVLNQECNVLINKELEDKNWHMVFPIYQRKSRKKRFTQPNY